MVSKELVNDMIPDLKLKKIVFIVFYVLCVISISISLRLEKHLITSILFFMLLLYVALYKGLVVNSELTSKVRIVFTKQIVLGLLYTTLNILLGSGGGLLLFRGSHVLGVVSLLIMHLGLIWQIKKS